MLGRGAIFPLLRRFPTARAKPLPIQFRGGATRLARTYDVTMIAEARRDWSTMKRALIFGLSTAYGNR
jgi:hypothetical protein